MPLRNKIVISLTGHFQITWKRLLLRGVARGWESKFVTKPISHLEHSVSDQGRLTIIFALFRVGC